MFWGMILKPDTRYKTTVEKSFRISHAALEFKKPEDSACVKLLCKELEFIICYLDAQKNIQIPLDLCFERDEEITLVAEGTATVHLTGLMEDDDGEDEDGEESYDYEQIKALAAAGKKRKKGSDVAASPNAKRSRKSVEEDESDEDDSDFEVDGGDSDEQDSLDEEEQSGDGDLDEGDSDVDMSDLDMESFDEDDEDEDEEETVESPKGKKQLKQKKQEKAPAQPKKEEKPQLPQGKKSTGPQIPEDKKPQLNGGQESKKKKRKRGSKRGGADGETTPKGNAGKMGDGQSPVKEAQAAKIGSKHSAKEDKAPGSVKKENQSPGKAFNKGGVQVQTLKPGNGPTAMPGKNVHVYYRGRLQSNGKEFDKQVDGKGFRFKLGAGEVIKGWDVGIEGMKVGEKRRLTVPAALAYGAKGAGKEIPPNSNLVFDVELKAVS